MQRVGQDDERQEEEGGDQQREKRAGVKGERDGVRKGQQREKREAAAMCVGGRVGRTLSLASTSAPFSTSSSATSLWPFFEAMWRGVYWSCEDRERKGQRKRP